MYNNKKQGYNARQKKNCFISVLLSLCTGRWRCRRIYTARPSVQDAFAGFGAIEDTQGYPGWSVWRVESKGNKIGGIIIIIEKCPLGATVYINRKWI